MFKRIAFFTYGSLSYLIFLGTFLYAIGFIGNFGVPTTLDGAPTKPLVIALLINAGLLTLFAVQHSVMARKWFKEWWTRIVPKPVERSTYVLFSSLALILLFWLWQPMGGVVWSVEDPLGQLVLRVLFGFGWALVLVSTFLINHFDLFGMRQVWLYLRGKPYTTLQFGTPGPYRLVRHPLYVGWLFAFWSTPTMTFAHLLFAVATTAYILLAIQLEERDLVREHGDSYESYRRSVPMLIPFIRRHKTQTNLEVTMKKSLPLSIFIGICCLLIGSMAMTTGSTSAATSVAVDNLSPELRQELAQARNATAKYHDFDRADEDGYKFLHCAEGEGLEYLNESLLDCNFDIEHPEALHYIREGNNLRLVGVEYVIPVACTATPPEGFTGDNDEWEFMAEGLPIWAMRAALWKPNPAGMFAEENPNIPPCE